MVILFEKHEVHYGFVRTLEKDPHTASSAKKLLQLQCNMADINQFWSDALMRFKEIKHRILDVQNVMTQVKRNSSFLPDGFEIVYKRVENCEKLLSSGLIKASECKNEQLIWKVIENLPDICQQIKGAVSSSVFWNVSFDEVYREYLLKSSEGVFDDPLTSLSDLFQERRVVDEHQEANCMIFMEILQTLGPTSYGNKWNELLKNEEFRLEEVFKMFGASPDILEEIQIAKQYLHIVIDSDMEECLKRIFSSETVNQTVDAMKRIVSVFGIDWQNDEIFATSITSYQQLLIGAAEDYTFSEVKVALNTVFSLVRNLSEDTVNIMIALGKATTLISFLRTIVDDDIKNLIDAVEDISEQQVRESTVSALIEVKQFLHPLLLQSERNCEDFFQILERQTKSSRANSASLPQKVEDCIQNLHNLKSLYNGVANRGEQTKEMIKNITQKGSYHFHLNRAKSIMTFEAFYTQNRLKETRKRSTLIDLRSRALLLMNTERKSMHESRFNRNELLVFVESIDLCLDIAGILFSLYASGHTGYMIIKETARPGELLTKKEELKRTLDLWLRDVNEERDSHYLMNFIQGNQIHLLFKYLEENRGDINTVQTILKFIHPNMQAINLQEAYRKAKILSNDWSNRQMLHCMGCALHFSFQGLTMFQRPIESQQIKNLNSIVQTSRLTVAQLDQGSKHTIRTMLALYMNTTQRLPEPNHIVLCTRETTWTELDLLIKRCLGASDFYKTKVLFCIANVEMLPSELQFSLVETLRHLRRDTKFYLAVICRGSRNHPFIDELSDCVKSVSPVTDKTVRVLFKEHCENVETVTSDLSGLGKSSYITSMAHKRHKGIATLHISGKVRKSQLVERINTLNVKGYQVLHIDLGNVDSPSELDTFLFELVVLRYVSAGNVSVSLKTSDVNIEIANTINNTLINSLQTAVLFQRVNLKWNGIESLIVSRELNSPVQVVCNYLKCLDNGTLDRKDLYLSKDSQSQLTARECKALLCRHLSREIKSSFPVLFTFIHVLADQLKKMNQSSFFKVSRLVDMVGSTGEITIKSKLVEAIIHVSKDFASRSVEVCRESQIATVETDELVESNVAASFIGRAEGMIRWEDSNHLMFVFHNQNIHTLSALYRNLSKVPAEIRNLFESQMKKEMEDFNKMDQEKLQILLQKVARENPLPLKKKYLNDLSKNYALTADNLLKMVLIMLRIKANIPVIVMGETGCGKTSLLRYLAQICEVETDVLNIHAGVKEEDILECVLANNRRALADIDKDRWLFLDEINTSDSIGFISDIICHHRCLGEELSPNLVILGACNPYKLRTTKAISTAGLEGKVKSDELSRLVYRVLPLPEIMVDYVWDFGSLNEKDEETYIHRMIADVFYDNKNYHDLFTSLLAVSQSFVRRKEESSYSVSLRDIQRCRTLTKWFLSVLPKKKLHQNAISNSCNVEIKSMILSLAHCYQSRFSEIPLRKEYQCVIGDTFKLNGYQFPEEPEKFIQTVIKEEQSDILGRMKLPPGTARNTALQENVFVILVCIFNRIPVFVVGKPGCSKSLAMQLIKSNLRGKDSEDDFFKELPQLYCVSFQGSESSTSDGIIKVFTKAEKYQESNNIEDVLSVVILDEIGLAEVSRFNPLKVLHNLLEPNGLSQPNVAVVGISNWVLDASKMNRAIHLSRTDMDESELYETAVSISNSFLGKETTHAFFGKSVDMTYTVSLKDIQMELKGMAKAYYQYIDQLRFKNFHGLRDYYSLIKFVARIFANVGSGSTKFNKADMIADGIARNFGGLPDEIQTLYDVFQRHIPNFKAKCTPLLELVTENIKDPIARHLMLITTGESVLGIVDQKLKEIGCERIEVILGSQFEEDMTDDYNYRILSRIILCMEEGMILILKDLESVYGSLYDMLNQNYTIIGKKKNCRVALGPYSNPICHVADSFRCIVLTDERKLDMTDPPFLNRFEKQYLRFFDIIEERHRSIIQNLEEWINELSDTFDGYIAVENMFPIYSKDLTTSLVLKAESESSLQVLTSDSYGSILSECKQKLLWILKPEVVIRQKMSKDYGAESASSEVIRQYFSLPLHNGLEYFIKQQTECSEDSLNGVLTVIFTNSNVHTKVNLTSSKIQSQLEKLGAYKSEKQFSSRIQHFWDTDGNNILIVQCNAKDDEKHILLTKLVIERYRNEYILQGHDNVKHVFFIIHLDRSQAASHSVSQLNFMSDWNLVMMDSLECPAIPLPTLCKMTLQEAVFAKRPLQKYIQEELFWAFSRIRYGQYGRDVDSISEAISKLEKSSELIELLEDEIILYIQRQCSGKYDKFWHIEVARDITALTSSASFIDALENFITSKIKTPLAKLIYTIEQKGVLESFFPVIFSEKVYMNQVCESKIMIWISVARDKRVFLIDEVPDETGPECYTCETADYALRMPFSKFIYDRIESTKNDFLETVRMYRLQCFISEDEELPVEVYNEVLLQQENVLLKTIPDLNDFTYRSWEEDYFHDFCTISAQAVFASPVKTARTEVTKAILERHGNVTNKDPFIFVIRLHTSFWVHFETVKAQMILIDKCITVIPESKKEIFQVLSHKRESDDLKTVQNADDKTFHSDTDVSFSEVYPVSDSSGIMTVCNEEEDQANVANEILLASFETCNDSTSENVLVVPDYALNDKADKFSDLHDKISDDSEILIHLESYRSKQHQDFLSKNSAFKAAEPVTKDLEKTKLDNTKNDTNTDKQTEGDVSAVENFMADKEGTVAHETSVFQADKISAYKVFLDPVEKTNQSQVRKSDMDANEPIEKCSATQLKTLLTDPYVDVTQESEEHVLDCSIVDNLEDIESVCDMLVFTVCRTMLPTTECLRHYRGVKYWLQEVDSIVSLAAQVSRSPELLYSLRVCTELAAWLIIPLQLNETLLENIGNSMKDGAALDTEDIFRSLENLLKSVLSSHLPSSYSSDISEVCLRTLSSYFIRCISANPQTTSFEFLFKFVLESDIPADCMTLFKVPISAFLKTVDAEMFIDVVSKEIIKEPGSHSKCSDVYSQDTTSKESGLHFLQSLNTCLKYLLNNERFNEPFLVLISDSLQDTYTEQFFLSKSSLTEDEETQETEFPISRQSEALFYICHKTIKEYEPGMKYIASIAFCNSFVNAVTPILQSPDTDDTSRHRLMNILDVVLSDLPGGETHFLTALFLKNLLSNVTFGQLQKYCITNEDNFNFIKRLQLRTKPHFEKSPLCVHITKSDHDISCFQHDEMAIDKYKVKIQSMIKQTRTGSCGMLQFFSFVLRDFYLHMSESDLDDTRRTQAKLILNEVLSSEISLNARMFTVCILGEHNFRTRNLTLTNAASVGQVCKASVLICFYALLLAYNELCSDKDEALPVFMKCLVYPEKLQSCLMPGFLAFSSKTVLQGEGRGFCLGRCDCGYRMQFNDTQCSFTCPYCELRMEEEKIDTGTLSALTEPQRNWQTIEANQISKHLNPVTCHTLQLLAKGCLLGAISLDFSSEKIIGKILMTTESDTESYLTDGINRHWGTLKEYLNISDNSLTALLHAIFLTAGDVLFKSSCSFKTETETTHWEKTFDRIVCSVLKSRFTHIRSVYGCFSENENSIEQRLLEMDEFHSNPFESKHVYLPAVYRLKAKPNKTNFCFELHVKQGRFPFLARVLDNEKDLKLPKHILCLVQWHAATVANASYLLKSHDCSTMTVQDFIYFKQDSLKKDVIKSRFEAFRKSWNELRGMLRKYDIVASMERIHSQSKLADCLILDEDSVPLRVLKLLAGIQNRFLDQVRQLADKCDSLKCLEKNTTPSVSVMTLKKENLIDYDVDWHSLLTEESNSNLAYGCGQQIHYDFHAIEEAVAIQVIFGKSYIVCTSLPEIVFIDELHKNYAFLLKEIRESTAQQVLPAEISYGIKSRKDDDPRMSTELLTHLGIVMTLLKKTGGNPDMSLIDFVDKWKSILFRHFPKRLLPSPDSCVKLCHVVALSELLEELSADSVKEGLGDEYRDSLDGPLFDQLMVQLKDDALSSVLFKAVKRFTYRCLASRIADPNQSLRFYLSDESFWQVDSFQRDALVIAGNRIELSDVLPDGLLVRHVFELFEIVEKEVEVCVLLLV